MNDRPMPPLSFSVGPAVGPEVSLEGSRVSLSEEARGQVCVPLPEADSMPLSALLPATIRSNPTIGGDSEITDGLAALSLSGFRVMAEMAHQEDLVDSTHIHLLVQRDA